MERIAEPGATTVTSGPTLEKFETVSLLVVDPTAMTPGIVVECSAGEITGPAKSFPVAAHKIMPWSLAYWQASRLVWLSAPPPL